MSSDQRRNFGNTQNTSGSLPVQNPQAENGVTKELINSLISEVRASTAFAKRNHEMMGFMQSQIDKVVVEQRAMNEMLTRFYLVVQDEFNNEANYKKLDKIIKTNESIDNYMMEFINVLNKNYSWNLARNYIVDNAQEMESLFSNKFNDKEDHLEKEISKRVQDFTFMQRPKLEPLVDHDLLDTASDGLSNVQNNINKIWKGYNKGGKPDVNVYKMSRDLTSVAELADEYFVGINGLPSVMNLDLHFGTLWRKNDRSFYSKRIIIINKIKDVVNNPKKYEIPDTYISEDDGTISLTLAIRIVENIRLGNNKYGRAELVGNKVLTLNRLYIYFKGKHDTIKDYDVLLSE